ncbi:MAG: peptide chain release factor N(5)-glutamine methyltransferase [Lachnospiraceae bacterium]|nr:peptide chain release factor N(5)-glutamine methyltransferase [Lachnospiraceae bacterium]MBO7362932.1 peptide chain release factor N(5)-glutamine methyltransferase [Lachnospiraceae bacterium]
MKASDLKKEILSRLEEAGIPDAETDTRILLKEYAGISVSDLYADPDKELPDSFSEDELEKAMELRVKRVPLQHIIGRTCFMGFDFNVSPAALIPRPDTEILAEEALIDHHDGSRILDLCTGTGCIIISLLALMNDCYGVATDISGDALALAERNASEILGEKKERLRFFEGDLYEAVPEGEKFEVIVSNPPYIRTADMETLMPEVKDHDPAIALDGGEDGLVFYRRIIEGAKDFLCPGGDLILEIGYDQAEDVTKIMKANRFTEVRTIKDFGGCDRVVRGILSSL